MFPEIRRRLLSYAVILGVPSLALGIVAETKWHKITGVLGATFLLVTRFLKLAHDVNGLGNYARGHNTKQDERIAQLEAKVANLEGVLLLGGRR